MEYQQWRNFGPYQPSEDDKILCRSLLKLLADQKNKQEYNMNKDVWFDFCSNVLGRPYNDEPVAQFLSRFPHIFAFTDLINDGEVLIKSNLALALCKDHLSKEGCHNTYCKDLHCCKFYLHDTCKFRDNCSFGHDLRRGRNNQILERCMLSLNWSDNNGVSSDFHPSQGLTPKKFGQGRDPGAATSMPDIAVSDLVQLLRQENPRVCKFYNSEGCKHGADGRKCPALHLCRQYVKFGQCTEAYCTLCHDIRSPQPFSLLSRYGYDVSVTNEQAILKQLQAEEVAVAGMTPVKRGSPPVEQLQQDNHYHHHFRSTGYGIEMPEDPYGPSYYGGALDFYESDDAAWSSQESRYCNDYQQMGYYPAEYPSDCEGTVPDHAQPMPPYTSLKNPAQLTHQNQYQQQLIYQVPSLIQKQQQMQQPAQLQQQQAAKSKEGELNVCRFYNYKGCRYGEGEPAEDGQPRKIVDASKGCQNLHLCGHFVNGACFYRTDSAKCKKSHDLHTEHTRAILEKHDIDATCGNDKAILAAIRQKISQQVIDMDDGSPSSSSSMERLSLDDLDPIEVKETPRKVQKSAKKTKEEEAMLRAPCRINTFVFLDLEATGLEQPRITELSLVCVYREDMEEFEESFREQLKKDPSDRDYLPRVVNKLTLCVHPRKDIEKKASTLTGLTIESLMHQKDFDYGLVNLLSEFLERLPAPICLVAHNGLRFDFPLLQAELVSIGRHGALPSDLLCLDTLVMFRSFEESLKHAQNSNQDSKSKASQPDRPALEQPVNVPSKKASSSQKQRTDWWGLSDDETDSSTPAKPKVETKSTIPLAPAFEDCVKKSFKLGDIHHRVTGKYPEETHRAEDDALTLIRCFVSTPGSLRWADENAILLNGVTPLVLPKRKPYETGVFPNLSQ